LYSSLDGQAMPGAMALSSWLDKLVDAYRCTADLGSKQELGDVIVRSLTERTEPGLATRDFTAKVQIVGALRNGECLPTDHRVLAVLIVYWGGSQRRDIREGQH
jgi:hypothetical protein